MKKIFLMMFMLGTSINITHAQSDLTDCEKILEVLRSGRAGGMNHLATTASDTTWVDFYFEDRGFEYLVSAVIYPGVDAISTTSITALKFYVMVEKRNAKRPWDRHIIEWDYLCERRVFYFGRFSLDPETATRAHRKTEHAIKKYLLGR